MARAVACHFLLMLAKSFLFLLSFFLSFLSPLIVGAIGITHPWPTSCDWRDKKLWLWLETIPHFLTLLAGTRVVVGNNKMAPWMGLRMCWSERHGENEMLETRVLPTGDHMASPSQTLPLHSSKV